MEVRKTCVNCTFFQPHYTLEANCTLETNFGHCTLIAMNERICRDTDSCNLWETNEEIGKKKYLQKILHDVALNFREIADVLDDINIA